jgi:hypothetical protein
MADPGSRRRELEAELRAAGRAVAVPPAPDLTGAVRQRLVTPAKRRRHLPALGTARSRRGMAWRAALVGLVTIGVLLIATPQGRAAITGVLRFAGIELRQGRGPTPGHGRGAALPGERRMTLAQARQRAGFPILVPAALGRPDEVAVSDGGRIVSLIYPRTPHGQLRLDEFAGRLDMLIFEKFIQFAHVTEVRVNGSKGLWLTGPHDLMYINAAGVPVAASARMTTGNTLIWGSGRVVLRLEGRLGRAAALAIARSAR